VIDRQRDLEALSGQLALVSIHTGIVDQYIQDRCLLLDLLGQRHHGRHSRQIGVDGRCHRLCWARWNSVHALGFSSVRPCTRTRKPRLSNCRAVSGRYIGSASISTVCIR